MSIIDPIAQQFDRLPPHDIEAERCLIASMMLDKAVIPKTLQLVSREMFYQTDHQIFFDVLVSLFKQDSPIDAVVVRSELQKRQLWEEVGGVDYLAQVLTSVPSASHATAYAKIVREKSALRGVIAVANDALREAYAPKADTSSARIVHSALNNLALLHGDKKESADRVDMEWRPFPVDALPPVMAAFAREAARSLCIDPAVSALPMLSIAGAAIGNTAIARMKSDWAAPPNIWSAVVMRSGEKKSPALKAAAKPLYERQHAMKQDHDQCVADYKEKLAQWKSRPKSERGDAPEEPEPYPHLYLSDTTVEAIAMRLDRVPRGLCIIRDELSAFFSSMNQYRSGGGSDRESYLAFYDASNTKIDRKGTDRPTISIPRAFVSVCGMIQPEILGRSLGASDFESGMAARFLFAAPPPQPAFWVKDGISEEVERSWRDTLFKLLDAPLPDKPKQIPLTPAAEALFVDCFDELEKQRFSERDDRLRAARAKLTGVIPRLAIIFQLVAAANDQTTFCSQIDELSMQRAITLGEWFINETYRVYRLLDSLGDSADADADDDRIIQRIREKGGVATARDLQFWFRRTFDKADDARRYLDSLVEEERGRWAYVARGGGRKVTAFVLF